MHIRPSAEVAERALLPGDPGRALRLAQALLEQPRMLNHHRGLWGYTGAAVADGLPLTIQSTGMGGPSAAIVVEELIGLGVRRLIRVGTCGALTAGAALGDLVIVESALCEDGASRALGAGAAATPDPGLLDALRASAGNGTLSGPVVSTDLFYDPDPGRAARWVAAGALARDLECAALLTIAGRHGARAACVLAVRQQVADGTIEQAALEEAELELGRMAVASLT